MRVKLAIVDGERAYLNRLTGAFLQNYADKIEVCAFSEKEAFEEFIKTNLCHMILYDQRLELGEVNIKRMEFQESCQIGVDRRI